MIPILFILFAAVGLSLSASPGCFQQSPPGGRHLHPTVFKECLDAIKEMVKYDKAHAPTLFSRKPGVGFTLPAIWVHRSCVVQISIPEDEEDSVSFFEIATEAGVVNGRCVARPPHFGGTIRVGPKEVINVSILGRPRRPTYLTPLDVTSDDTL